MSSLDLSRAGRRWLERGNLARNAAVPLVFAIAATIWAAHGGASAEAATGAGVHIDHVIVATVVQTEDPTKTGRIKVRFPWLPSGEPSHQIEEWARVLAPITSQRSGDTGPLTLPERGGEVIVALMSGDIHKPVVLGTLWSGEPRVGD
jgi:uncharacterized protein involved in type VI secretion and phage assembly